MNIISLYDAVAIAEGRFEEAGLEQEDVTEEIVIDAWQYLIDTGAAWTLQGSIGRQAVSLIDQGICTP